MLVHGFCFNLDQVKAVLCDVCGKKVALMVMAYAAGRGYSAPWNESNACLVMEWLLRNRD